MSRPPPSPAPRRPPPESLLTTVFFGVGGAGALAAVILFIVANVVHDEGWAIVSFLWAAVACGGAVLCAVIALALIIFRPRG
ncbi:hypothetical protein [Dactylosporangium sp. CS-033363]|uniref:hypothetical protein n=1 Tax=Dactylosporangium sp. CS-033363 TaxID=3239935 RepID=UPI003D93915A